MSSTPTRIGFANARSAFTLIELLVVVAIIVVLLSLLIPGLDMALDHAATAKCMSNMNALGKGMGMYRLENKRYYPAHHTPDVSQIAVWMSRIRKYCGDSTEAFNCPEMEDERAHWEERYYYDGVYDSSYGGFDTTAQQPATGEEITISVPRQTNPVDPPPPHNGEPWGYRKHEIPIFAPDTFFSYGYNDWGTAGAFGQLGLGGWAGGGVDGEVKNVTSPQSMIMIGDSTINGIWDACIDPTNGNEMPRFRHRSEKECAVIWADGHATTEGKWMIEITEAQAPDTYRGNRSKWNRDNKPH